MSVKKAITALDMLIENKQKVRAGVLDPAQSWNQNKDLVGEMANMMADEFQNDVKWLQAIKRHLLPEQHRTKIACRHPKKDHAVTADGQKYCINCNADL
ncbi:MAG: hypothetical protein WAO91_04635 [Candidatus Nitrosotenuis sp.]